MQLMCPMCVKCVCMCVYVCVYVCVCVQLPSEIHVVAPRSAVVDKQTKLCLLYTTHTGTAERSLSFNHVLMQQLESEVLPVYH